MFDETKNNGENSIFPEDSEENSVNPVSENTENNIEEITGEFSEVDSESVNAHENEVDEQSGTETVETPSEPVMHTEPVFAKPVTEVYENTDKPKKKKSSGKGFKVFVAVLLTVFTVSSLLLATMVAMDVIFDSDFSFKVGAGNEETPENNPENDKFDYGSVTVDTPNYVAFDFKEREGQVLSIPEIAAKCSPSSVGIVSEIETTSSYSFFFGPSTSIARASGSGFVYSADGYIITNHHVIDNAVKIKVILYDNKEFEATVVGSDELSDIAVLKINVDENTKLIPMEIGNSDELVVGEAVVAIGCPAGIEFIGTVTDGIISAINRNVEITDSYGNVQKNMALIQTNATINHGNSGGPLINTRGQVIGINTLKLSADYEGVGFSIPMNGAVPIIKQLIEHGKVIERTEEDFAYGKGIIGITGSAISEEEAEYYNIPQGVLVVQINREGSAAKAGLRRGDIITHYNGKEVKTVDDINAAKGSSRAGSSATVTVYRDSENGDGETFDISFKLDAQ